MKKALSLFLAVLMIMSVMAVSVSAIDIRKGSVCTCEDHDKYNPCHCCIYCDNLDNDYVNDCCKQVGNEWVFCCRACNGLWNCGCVSCDCCATKDQPYEEPDSPALIPGNVQQNLISSFQNAMATLMKSLRSFFDRIFEFLRIDEYFGSLEGNQ